MSARSAPGAAAGPSRGTPASHRPAVMLDVGRLAGVSHMTVSRVVNGSPNVRPATRERVLAAMEDLGYRPSAVARALATGRTRILGVLSFETTLQGAVAMLFEIERAAQQEGYSVLIAASQRADLATTQDAIERLRADGVEGILALVSGTEAAASLREVSHGVPLVAVGGGPDCGLPAVSVDQRTGARLATQHLLDLGHRTVHHVSGPPGSTAARQRIEGWRAALRDARAPEPPPLVGDWSAQSGYHLGRRLASDPGFSATFVANDRMALGVLRALHEAGRAVPDEISLVGFDDTPDAPYFTPPLTTVCQDFAEVGGRSLRVLVETIEAAKAGQPPPQGSLVAPALVVRASTRSPAKR